MSCEVFLSERHLAQKNCGGRSAGQLHLGLKEVRTRVPFTGEVAWMQPEGRKPYSMGTVIAITFEVAP
jgi:hypothetical protein